MGYLVTSEHQTCHQIETEASGAFNSFAPRLYPKETNLIPQESDDFSGWASR